jgi:hypothetical protein
MEMRTHSLYHRRMQALLEDRPIPMTLTEAKRFRTLVCHFISEDIKRARMDEAIPHTDESLRKLNRIEAFAFAAIMESYRGERA